MHALRPPQGDLAVVILDPACALRLGFFAPYSHALAPFLESRAYASNQDPKQDADDKADAE